jgi:predicted RNA binding protein YcfA (HicA-like mRNA interferase family)
MKRRDLIRHLKSQGCHLLREGGNHSVYLKPSTKRISTVPRHNEVNDYLVRKICRDLQIQEL